MEEVKSDFVSGIGGLCFSINISTYYLLKAIGFDAALGHATCSSSIRFHNNHVVVYVSNVERPGDRFLVETGFGFPTFQAVSLDFEEESPVYVSSYLEYKYVKHDGHILRMHRKGDHFASKKERNPELDFFIGDFRRFYEAEVECYTEFSEFDKYNREIYLNPQASPFLTSHRFLLCPGKKSSIFMNGKALKENDNGELEVKETFEKDEDIVTAIKQLSPDFPEDIILKSLRNWRIVMAKKT